MVKKVKLIKNATKHRDLTKLMNIFVKCFNWFSPTIFLIYLLNTTTIHCDALHSCDYFLTVVVATNPNN